MRVGITLRSHDPSWGGPGTYTIEIVKHLLRADPRNEYVLLYPRSAGVRRFLGQYQAQAPRVLEVDTRTRSGHYTDQVAVPRLARKLGIDLLFSPFTSLPIHGRFRKVMTIHGAERYTVPGVLSWRASLSWRLMETVTLWRADRVLAVSETMKRDFCQALGFPPERVSTTYLGVDPTFRPVADGERLRRVREHYQLPDDFLLFVGYLFPNKNFTNLLKGFHAIAGDIPHQLVVCGGRRWKYEADLALVDVLGLRDRVRFLNVVPLEDLVALYSLAACFVFPSLYESFGLAMVEAMACGCPVVASNTGALPEIARDAALFCDPRSPDDIGGTIRKLVGDPALRATYRAKGMARAREFTWERTARNTLQVFRELA
jgi:glycosyltransferase involved in cell wall biosynthesis